VAEVARITVVEALKMLHLARVRLGMVFLRQEVATVVTVVMIVVTTVVLVDQVVAQVVTERQDQVYQGKVTEVDMVGLPMVMQRPVVVAEPEALVELLYPAQQGVVGLGVTLQSLAVV
jgi:hypothetical protein